jgi:hypothetical protein
LNPSFEDIRSLFRPTDVEAMAFVFDLSSYDDVREYSHEIYARLSDGTMPCDVPWPEERILRFRQWMDAGMPE